MTFSSAHLWDQQPLRAFQSTDATRVLTGPAEFEPPSSGCCAETTAKNIILHTTFVKIKLAYYTFKVWRYILQRFAEVAPHPQIPC